MVNIKERGSNLALTHLGGETIPWYILFYNFLVTHPNFMKFGDFYQNLSGIDILDFFFSKFEPVFAVGFSWPSVIILCMSSVGIMVIALAILVIFESRGFRKKLTYSLF